MWKDLLLAKFIGIRPVQLTKNNTVGYTVGLSSSEKLSAALPSRNNNSRMNNIFLSNNLIGLTAERRLVDHFNDLASTAKC